MLSKTQNTFWFGEGEEGRNKQAASSFEPPAILTRFIFTTGDGRRLESAVALSHGSAFTLQAAAAADIASTYPEVFICLNSYALLD